MTKEFTADEKGHLKALTTVNVRWEKDANGGRPNLVEEPNSEKEWPCELALLALGFTGPEPTLAEKLGLDQDARSNVKGNEKYQTNVPHIFTAGDMRRGQSLIVWAISEGREAAHHIDTYLMGEPSKLPIKEGGDLPTN